MASRSGKRGREDEGQFKQRNTRPRYEEDADIEVPGAWRALNITRQHMTQKANQAERDRMWHAWRIDRGNLAATLLNLYHEEGKNRQRDLLMLQPAVMEAAVAQAWQQVQEEDRPFVLHEYLDELADAATGDLRDQLDAAYQSVFSENDDGMDELAERANWAARHSVDPETEADVKDLSRLASTLEQVTKRPATERGVTHALLQTHLALPFEDWLNVTQELLDKNDGNEALRAAYRQLARENVANGMHAQFIRENL